MGMVVTTHISFCLDHELISVICIKWMDLTDNVEAEYCNINSISFLFTSVKCFKQPLEIIKVGNPDDGALRGCSDAELGKIVVWYYSRYTGLGIIYGRNLKLTLPSYQTPHSNLHVRFTILNKLSPFCLSAPMVLCML